MADHPAVFMARHEEISVLLECIL